MATHEKTTPQPENTYIRFDLSQRIEHIVFLISFTILGITGLVQKYCSLPRQPGSDRSLGWD